jgi:HD superfamily phosphodiesterase
MDFIQSMLTDKKIISLYSEIDKVNNTPSNHGMKHIYGVVKLSDEFGKVLGLTERELLILKTCEVLHDIGQTDGRKNHGVRSRQFAENYLPSKNIFTSDELELIYSCIETHDECKDYSKLKSKMAFVVNVVDKLDFSKTRLEDFAFERFGYLPYHDIDHIECEINQNVFKILIKTIDNPKVATEETLFSLNLFAKGMRVFKIFCEKFGFVPEVWLENKQLNLNKIQDDVILDR